MTYKEMIEKVAEMKHISLQEAEQMSIAEVLTAASKGGLR